MRRRMYVRAWSALTGLAVRSAHLPGIGAVLNVVLFGVATAAWVLGSTTIAAAGLVLFAVAVVFGELHMLTCRACCPDDGPEVSS